MNCTGCWKDVNILVMVTCLVRTLYFEFNVSIYYLFDQQIQHKVKSIVRLLDPRKNGVHFKFPS